MVGQEISEVGARAAVSKCKYSKNTTGVILLLQNKCGIIYILIVFQIHDTFVLEIPGIILWLLQLGC